MEIASGAVAKAAMAAAFIGLGGTGIYLTSDYLKGSPNPYDVALLDFLHDHNDNDIIFEVKKGDNADQDLDANDLVFSTSNPAPVTAKVKVVADTSKLNTTFIKGDANGNSAKLDAIQNLGGKNKTWTWECSFKFEVEEANKAKPIQDDYKNRIWKHPDLGLFGLLKKKLSEITNPTGTETSNWSKADVKKVKAGFIERCGQYREENKQKAPETKGEENITIKAEDITIAFQKVSSEDKLEPKDKDLFDHYFLRKEDKDKTYKTST